jgi:hypothetical protein
MSDTNLGGAPARIRNAIEGGISAVNATFQGKAFRLRHADRTNLWLSPAGSVK